MQLSYFYNCRISALLEIHLIFDFLRHSVWDQIIIGGPPAVPPRKPLEATDPLWRPLVQPITFRFILMCGEANICSPSACSISRHSETRSVKPCKHSCSTEQKPREKSEGVRRPTARSVTQSIYGSLWGERPGSSVFLFYGEIELWLYLWQFSHYCRHGNDLRSFKRQVTLTQRNLWN